MVTQQILVLFFLVRIQVAQLFSTIIYYFLGLWCNGNTTDSGPVFLGSNPGSPTEEDRFGDLFLFLFLSALPRSGGSLPHILFAFRLFNNSFR